MESTVRYLTNKGVNLAVMITLTEDLVSKLDTVDFITNMLNKLGASSADFDYLIGSNYPSPDKVDDYLIRLYDAFSKNCPNCTFTKANKIKKSLKQHKKFKDCSNFYTILPSGNIKHGCAYCNELKVRKECKFCEYLISVMALVPLQKVALFQKAI